MEVVNFLRDYWQFISTGIILVFGLLFTLLKKPYKVYGYYLDFINWVKEAEDKYGSGHGSEKLEYVYQKYINKYSDTNYTYARRVVSSAVDFILSTPQKKEPSHEKVK